MVRRIPRLTFDQVVPENRFDVLGVPLLDQKSRKVHAADQVAIACVPASAFKTAMDAEFVELRRDIAGAHRAPIANGRQSLAKLRMLWIYAQADNMQGLPAPANRNFDTIDKHNAMLGSSSASFIQPTHLVVIGQGEHLDAARGRMFHQLRGGQQPVGSRGMAVKINVEHEAIVREARYAS